MMTRTCAQDLQERDIFMNSVDTGWINDENPLQKAAAHAAAANFQASAHMLRPRCVALTACRLRNRHQSMKLMLHPECWTSCLHTRTTLLHLRHLASFSRIITPLSGDARLCTRTQLIHASRAEHCILRQCVSGRVFCEGECVRWSCVRLDAYVCSQERWRDLNGFMWRTGGDDERP